MPGRCLTSELVDAVEPPARGETWIADNHLAHFGIRAWAGKKGGGKAYAIRLRDQFGVLVRESYRPHRDYPLYFWEWERAWEQSLGNFLDKAREWARDRIAIHLGKPTSDDRRHRRWMRRKARILSTTVSAAFESKIARLRQKSENHLYLDQIDGLIDKHIPPDILAHTFRDVPIRRLADAISNRSISYGNVKVLRAFVGGVFKDAAAAFGPHHYKLESIQRRCASNLDARRAPPHPRILKIPDADYRRFFDMLETESHWRQALAIRLYFATGAKLQVVLRARWSDILNGVWHPFLPNERKLWFESRERLGEDALAILDLLQARHSAEQLSSPYLFPSPANPSQPIKTVQRHWSRYADIFAWNGLPLSHVVLRQRGRSNPSYSLFFHRTYWQFDRPEADLAVSKVANRRIEKDIDAVSY